MSEISAAEAEKYVRKRFEVKDSRPTHAGHGWVVTLPIICTKSGQSSIYRKSEPECWKEAYEFTIAREEQIRQIEEEIEWIQDCIDMSGIMEPIRGIPEQRRILAREQAALADLKRGLKGS